MIAKEELDKIAELSRIAIEEGEKEKLRQDIDGIVVYISMLQNAPSSDVAIADDFIPKNTFRSDTEPHLPMAHTEAILKQAPRRKDDYVVVKKIL